MRTSSWFLVGLICSFASLVSVAGCALEVELGEPAAGEESSSAVLGAVPGTEATKGLGATADDLAEWERADALVPAPDPDGPRPVPVPVPDDGPTPSPGPVPSDCPIPLAGGSVEAVSVPEECQFCGNLLCEPGETLRNCPWDCARCGDGRCTEGGGESTATCWRDCGTRCGDRVCNGAENADSCWDDCRPRLSSVLVQKVRYCRSSGPICNSTQTDADFHWWDRFDVAKEKQKRTFIADASEPAPEQVERLVFIAAGQQNSLDDDEATLLTGQSSSWKNPFGRRDSRRRVSIGSQSLARRLFETESFHFDPSTTYMGLALDARFNYNFSSSNKREIENAYYEWLQDKFEPGRIKLIYLAGFSRGGCLVLRLARRFTLDYPDVPVVVSAFDPVCKGGEFGASSCFPDPLGCVDNPIEGGSDYARATDMRVQFENRDNLRVLNMVAGECVTNLDCGVRPLSHRDHSGNNPMRIDDWYEQRWYEAGHVAMGNSTLLIDRALAHLRTSCRALGVPGC